MSTTTQTNGITLDILKERAEKLGEQSAQGADTQIKFHLSIFEGAFHGVLTLDGDKHGKGVDDAHLLSETYFKARNKNVIWDHKAPNQRKLISTARLDIKGGNLSKFGPDEPLNTVNNLMDMWRKLRRDPANSKRLIAATDVLHRFLRVISRPGCKSLPDMQDLQAYCFKSPPDPKTLIDFWETQRKQYHKLRVGTLASSTLQDDAAEVKQIEELIANRIKAINDAVQADSEITTEDMEETASTMSVEELAQ